jgi:large subunit ribosomal protein L25
MVRINAEIRDTRVKGKHLRESGLIPGSVYGGSLPEPLHVQLKQKELLSVLKDKTPSGKMTIGIGADDYVVLIREVSRKPVKDQIEHVSFQCLVRDQMVFSEAHIVLDNKDKVSGSIAQQLYEIPYKAYPSNLVEEFRIDLDGMPEGTSVRVEDLPIAQNEDITLLVNQDTLVFSINESKISAS